MDETQVNQSRETEHINQRGRFYVVIGGITLFMIIVVVGRRKFRD